MFNFTNFFFQLTLVLSNENVFLMILVLILVLVNDNILIKNPNSQDNHTVKMLGWKVASERAVLHISLHYCQWTMKQNRKCNTSRPQPSLQLHVPRPQTLCLYLWTRRSEYVLQMKGLWSVRRMAVRVAEGVCVVRSCRSHINQHLKTEAHFHSGKQTERDRHWVSRQNTTDRMRVWKIQIQTWSIFFSWRVSESRHRTGLK